MRKINSDELPDNCFIYPLIKCSTHNRHLRNILAIQKTLEHCNKIRTEFEAELDELRTLNENKGYLAGLSLVFNELVHILVLYEEKQNNRFSAYKDFLKSQVESAFIDPEMVDIIISYIQTYFKDDKKITLVFPEKFKAILGDCNAYDGLVYADSFDFSAKNDTGIIMLPYTALCEKVFSETDIHIENVNKDIHFIIPKYMDEIISALLQFKEAILIRGDNKECEYEQY